MTQGPSEAPAASPDRSLLLRELSALGALFWLTLRQHVRGRKLLVLAVLYLLLCGLAILLRSLARPAPADILEFALIHNLVPHVLAPLTALLYASAMIHDEVEEQTLTYLLLRPLPRWALYLAKWLATLLTTILLTAVFTMALYVSIYQGTAELWNEIVPERAVKTALVLAAALAGYCSLFGLMSLLVRRTLLAGVVYIAFLEGLVANLDFVARGLTVVYYYRILILRWLDLPEEVVRGYQREWQLNLAQAPGGSSCVQTLLVASLILACLSSVWFATREFPMKTPESA
jgi:ABC-2 type transport system permease protein